MRQLKTANELSNFKSKYVKKIFNLVSLVKVSHLRFSAYCLISASKTFSTKGLRFQRFSFQNKKIGKPRIISKLISCLKGNSAEHQYLTIFLIADAKASIIYLATIVKMCCISCLVFRLVTLYHQVLLLIRYHISKNPPQNNKIVKFSCSCESKHASKGVSHISVLLRNPP